MLYNNTVCLRLRRTCVATAAQSVGENRVRFTAPCCAGRRNREQCLHDIQQICERRDRKPVYRSACIRLESRRADDAEYVRTHITIPCSPRRCTRPRCSTTRDATLFVAETFVPACFCENSFPLKFKKSYGPKNGCRHVLAPRAQRPPK